MIHLRDTWQQLVQDVPRVEDDFSPVVHLTPHADAFLLSELTPQTVQRWMADATVDEPGADTKMAAAYLMGDVANTVCQVFAALALRGHWLAAAGTGSVGMIPRFVQWDEDGESGVSMTFDICLAHDAQLFAYNPYGTIGKVLVDAGFDRPDLIEAIALNDTQEFTPEVLPELDGDFIITTYRSSAGDTPDTVRGYFEGVIPGYCDLLHACREGQMYFLSRAEAAATSYSALIQTA